jgi:ATP-dependent Clp protease ATP-binding subunit ClpC
MTSNIGVRDLKDFGAGIGFSSQAKKDNSNEIMKSTIQNALKKAFSPEFLNRLDDVIVFNSLEREHLHKIIDISLKKVFDRMLSLGYDIELTEKAKDFLSEKGYDQQYGARPLNRAIQKYLEDLVAEEILSENIKVGDSIIADHDGKSEKLFIKQKKGKKKDENPENKEK